MKQFARYQAIIGARESKHSVRVESKSGRDDVARWAEHGWSQTSGHDHVVQRVVTATIVRAKLLHTYALLLFQKHLSSLNLI